MEKDIVYDFERPLSEIKEKIFNLLEKKEAGEKINESEMESLKNKYEALKTKVYGELTPWQRVQIARHPKRPYLTDYIPRIFDDFMELHGDRAFADDAAIVGGLAMFNQKPVVIIGHRKGRSLQESMERNFGMPHPEGYRKTLRLMELAERFQLPIFSFVDTAGAYPGIGAEERGQAEAIARNLREMSALEVPIIVTILAEGGSGGALAIGIGNVVLMMENAWYSVISPEGCAAILFHDATKAPMAAEALKLTAEDLKKIRVVDEIIPEPLGGAQEDPDVTAKNLKSALTKNLSKLEGLSAEKLISLRYDKFRSIGAWLEGKPASTRQKKVSKKKSIKNKDA